MKQTTQTPPAGAWFQSLLALILCIAWILFWYRDTATAMVGIWWRSETFAHAFLVPPISLWLIWRRRAQIAALSPSPSLSALGLMVVVGIGWLLGHLAAMNSATQFALVAMLVLSVPAVLGWHVARAMAFPLGFLFFAVPVGEFVVPQFMEWTANFAVAALRLSGIPVYREGQHFVIPSGSWSVVSACSGVRYLIASVVVGTLYAYLSYRSLAKRLIFVVVSIVVPIVANWVRAYLIVLIGHLSNNTLAVGVDHLIYGWLFFGVVIILLYAIAARWADPPRGDLPVGPAAPSARRAGGAWLAAALLAAVTLLPAGWNRQLGEVDAVDSDALRMATVPGWEATVATTADWRPSFKDPSAELRSVYRQDDRRVGLFIGYYAAQTHERKLVSSENRLVMPGDEEWAQVRGGTRQITVGGVAASVRTAELRNVDQRRLVAWQWYWVDGRLTASDYLAKIYTAWARLIGHGDDSAVIVLSIPTRAAGGEEAALETFVKSAGGAIDAALRGVRRQTAE